jgi:DNA-binding NtrC family response regulator
MKLLMDYDWPGNVRELENAVERAIVLSTHESMDADLLPESVRTREIVKGVRLQLAEFLPPLPGRSRRTVQGVSPSLFEILEEVERRIIVDMLERTNWNQTEAAERFQIPLSTLNQKIKRLGIETRRRPAPVRGTPGLRRESCRLFAPARRFRNALSAIERTIAQEISGRPAIFSRMRYGA